MTDKSLVMINGHIIEDASKVHFYQGMEDISCGTICNIDISNIIINNSHIIIGNGYIITTCQEVDSSNVSYNNISYATIDNSNNLYENIIYTSQMNIK